MNKYEIMLIMKPDIEDDVRNSVLDMLKNVLMREDGTVDNVDEWGLREFAYEIQHYKKGYYLVINTTTVPDNIAEFERLSRINPNVMRYMTLRMKK